MRIPLALLLAAVFACACKKKESAVAPEAGSGDSTTQESAPPIELTDALMGQYVDITKKMRDAKDGGASLLASNGWAAERYYRISGMVTAGFFSAASAEAAKGSAAMQVEFDKNLKEMKDQLAKAPESERASLQQQIDATQTARDQLSASTPVATDLDRRNAEVLKRWQTRLNEIDKQK